MTGLFFFKNKSCKCKLPSVIINISPLPSNTEFLYYYHKDETGCPVEVLWHLSCLLLLAILRFMNSFFLIAPFFGGMFNH